PVAYFLMKYPAPSEIYTLSLHDALPISLLPAGLESNAFGAGVGLEAANAGFDERVEWDLVEFERECTRIDARQLEQIVDEGGQEDRKSTRLNSSHLVISYAVFCLKKNTI